MATISDVCVDALGRIGAIAAGESPSSADLEKAYTTLNQLQDSFVTERLMIPYVLRSTWPLVSGTQNYTVGTGGTVNIVRPVYINQINFQDTSQSPILEYQLGPLMTDDGWASIAQKTLQSQLPTNVYYNPTYPLGTVTFWPVPTSTTLQGVMYAPVAVPAFTSQFSTLIVPPGYHWFLVTNLAKALCTPFFRPMTQEIKDEAAQSMRNVKRMNFRSSDLGFDAGALPNASGWWSRARFISGP